MIAKQISPWFVSYTLLLVLCNYCSLHADTQPRRGYISLIVCATTGYFLGAASNYILCNMVEHAYTAEQSAISLYDPYTSELKEEIVRTLLERHNKETPESDPYFCYPFVRYKENLDWYIKWLGRSSYFNQIIDHDSQNLIGILREISIYIVQDYRYIQERREYLNA